MANDPKQQQPQQGRGQPQAVVQPTQGSNPQQPHPMQMPDGKPLPTRKGWEEMCQEYLWDKGWKPDGYSHDEQVLWADPQGSLEPGKMQLSHTTKDESGNHTEVMQYYAPPIPWSHKTADAYGIQRARDQYEADAPKRAAKAQADELRKKQYQDMLAAKRAQRMGVLANAGR